MMNASVVQYNDYFSFWVGGNNGPKEIQKRLGRVLLVFLPDNPAYRIVHGGQQLDAAVFACCLDNSLFTAEKPRLLNRLVVPDHRFVFKQQMIDFIV